MAVKELDRTGRKERGRGLLAEGHAMRGLDERPERPPHVRWALLLLWASLAAEGARALWAFDYASPELPIRLGAEIFGLAVAGGACAWVYARVRAGRGWARWLCAVATLLGCAVSVSMAAHCAGSSPAGAAALCAEAIAQACAVGLLLSARASAWFASSRAWAAWSASVALARAAEAAGLPPPPPEP